MRTSTCLAMLASAGLFVSSINAATIAQPGAEGTIGTRSAQPDEPARGARRGGRPEGAPLSVRAAMKALNRGYRQLRDQVGSSSRRDENLRIIGEMQRAAIIAKQQPIPDDLLSRTTDEEARARLARTYRSDLIATLRILLDLEEAVIAGNADAAKEKLSSLIRLRDRSHDALGVNEDVDEGANGDGGSDPAPRGAGSSRP